MLKKLSSKISQWLVEEPLTPDYPLCDFERIRYELRPCDVILIEGQSRVSDSIRIITQSPWTHSCLYIGRIHDIDDPALREKVSASYSGSPDEQLLLEGMLGQGTIVAPLSQYEKNHIRICRPRGISRQDAQQVIAHTIARLGTEYDVRQIFDLARFFFPWAILPRRWRSSIFSYNPGSCTKTVCSTVIAEAFMDVSFPIMPVLKEKDSDGNLELVQRNPRLFAPRDFDYSPYFEIIKYPFIQVVEQGIYRQLPWNSDGLLSNDQHGIVDPNTLPTQSPRGGKPQELPSEEK